MLFPSFELVSCEVEGPPKCSTQLFLKDAEKPRNMKRLLLKKSDGSFEGWIYLLCLFYRRVHKIVMPKKTYLLAGGFIVFIETNPADLFKTHTCCFPSQWAGNEGFSI